jgi:hypothetical protein
LTFISLTNPVALGSWFYSASNRNENHKQKYETLLGSRAMPVRDCDVSLSLSRLFRHCRVLNISQPHRPPRSVTAICLLLYFLSVTVELLLIGRCCLPVEKRHVESKTAVFWDMTSRDFGKRNRRFGGDTFIRNVSSSYCSLAVSYARREYSSPSSLVRIPMQTWISEYLFCVYVLSV